MPRVNVWVPEDLHAQAKEAGLSFSTVIQAALRAALGLMPPTEHEKAQKQALREIATGLDVPAEALAADDGINHWAQAEEAMRPVVDCTNPGVLEHPAGFKIRHVGEKKQLDYGPICTACNRAWR